MRPPGIVSIYCNALWRREFVARWADRISMRACRLCHVRSSFTLCCFSPKHYWSFGQHIMELRMCGWLLTLRPAGLTGGAWLNVQIDAGVSRRHEVVTMGPRWDDVCGGQHLSILYTQTSRVLDTSAAIACACLLVNQSTVARLHRRRGTDENTRVVASSQILLGQLGRAETKISKSSQGGQAGQATDQASGPRPQDRPRPPKTIQLTHSQGCKKLDSDLRRPTNDDNGRPSPRQSTHRLRIFNHRPRWRQRVSGASVEKQGTGPRWSTDLNPGLAESLLWLLRQPLIGVWTATATSSPRPSATVLLFTGRSRLGIFLKPAVE